MKAKLLKSALNVSPLYRGTGGRVLEISPDFRRVVIALPLSMRTRNYVGTIFGGSMFAATDPFYMIMLIENLGPDFVCWDKSASIRFLKPGRSTLTCVFTIDDALLERVRTALKTRRSFEETLKAQLVDKDGVVHAEIERGIYVRRAATVLGQA